MLHRLVWKKAYLHFLKNYETVVVTDSAAKMQEGGLDGWWLGCLFVSNIISQAVRVPPLTLSVALCCSVTRGSINIWCASGRGWNMCREIPFFAAGLPLHHTRRVNDRCNRAAACQTQAGRGTQGHEEVNMGTRLKDLKHCQSGARAPREDGDGCWEEGRVCKFWRWFAGAGSVLVKVAE